MRSLILISSIFISMISVQASAAVATQLNVAFGASVPVDSSGQTLVEKSGPTRASGGEHFVLHLGTAKTIADIKMTAYSTGHLGKVLVHSAIGTNGTTKVSLDGLSQFAKVTKGAPQNYQNLVMLTDTNFVEVEPNQAFSQLDIVLEGFTNDDTSLLLQVVSNDGFPPQDFLLTRTGSSDETVGGLINETTYAKFSPTSLQSLVTYGTDPLAADLVGKTFACSVYTKLNPTQVDGKKRAYSSASSGAILSSSDVEGSNLPWTQTGDGLEMSTVYRNGCGNFTAINVLRKTPSGNLISEVVLNLNDYINLCVAAGYDGTATRAVETNSTFPSLVNPKYVVDSYEFCHATN